MQLLDEIKNIVGDRILSGAELKDRYNHIYKMNEPLNAVGFVMPITTEEISKIMKVCSSLNQNIVVFGGLTNLVGSTETNGSELVISMEKMNNVLEVDPKSRTLTTEAGAILENVQAAAEEHNLLFPLNFGAKGSAQIGGAIATNAGGLRVLKYGMTRNLVLGLEVVMADGTVISSLKKIIKDNSAYDIKQLFIGSEGSLGIVTKAVLKLVEQPKSKQVSMLGISDYQHVVSFLKHMDAGLGGKLSGYELMWNYHYKTVTTHSDLRPPLPYDYPYYVLVESHGSDHLSDQTQMQDLIESAFNDGLLEDAVFAQNSSDYEWFFKIRENVDIVIDQCKFDQHFDISLPIPSIGEVIEDIQTKLNDMDDVEHVFTFGHVADGNIHLMIGKMNDSIELKNAINDVVYTPLKSIGGSVSAEHGIGLHKKEYLHLCRNKSEIELMKRLKRQMDPKNILNPGKVLDV